VPGGHLISALKHAVGDANVTADPADLALYAYDATMLEHLPDVVVFPSSTDQVASVLKIAQAEGIPVVPRGAGSGLSGGAVPAGGGIVLSMTRMNRILGIDAANLVCRTEAGVVTGAIADAAAALGLYYPPDPSSLRFCTIGGNIAHNAGGLHALKYGVTKNYLLGLTAVLPSGEVLKTGVQTMKGVVGYDLTRLICGSEGTLAVATEATLKLIPQPAHRAVAVAAYPTPGAAGEAVSAVIAAKILPAMLEFMDNMALRCVEEYLKVGFPADAGGLLLMEIDGHPDAVKAELAAAVDILKKYGATSVRFAEESAECEKLWDARRAVAPSLGKVSPRRISEDITIPRNAIPAVIDAIGAIGRKHALPTAVFGHAGDGNLHVNFLVDSRDEALKTRIKASIEEVLGLALEKGGTLSGEHGVGLTKKAYIGLEIGPDALRILREIKRTFDPNNILNPGKILPDG
jgi:glycolate oxidase